MERPIIFSGDSVKAILDGRKTMTRRVVKADAREVNRGPDYRWWYWKTGSGPSTPIYLKCPYGKPGDQLWVRETTVRVEEHGFVGPVYVASDDGMAILNYGLGSGDETEVEPHDLKLRPSIFMPRSMSRINLEITDVRVERLQDISEEDAKAEGVTQQQEPVFQCMCEERCMCGSRLMSFRESFQDLWDEINGKKHPWASNPWVWVLTFRRVEK